MYNFCRKKTKFCGLAHFYRKTTNSAARLKFYELQKTVDPKHQYYHASIYFLVKVNTLVYEVIWFAPGVCTTAWKFFSCSCKILSIFCLESSSSECILCTYWLLRNRRSAFSCSNLRTDDLRSEKHQNCFFYGNLAWQCSNDMYRAYK